MLLKLKSLELIEYLSFLGLFVSLLTTYWVYSFENVSNLGNFQAPTYPYRGFTFPLALLCILLSGIFFYSGIRARKGCNFADADTTNIYGIH
jgi:hypothetical protein